MKQTLVNVAENLWKSQQSGRYYAILKVNGRQIKKSLKTNDYQLAKRTLRELEKYYQERTGIVGVEPLRDILEFARDNGWMMHDPTAKLDRLKLPRPNPDPPTEEEFRRLVITLRSHRDRDAADLTELMAYSGLRLSEACGLKWADV